MLFEIKAVNVSNKIMYKVVSTDGKWKVWSYLLGLNYYTLVSNNQYSHYHYFESPEVAELETNRLIYEHLLEEAEKKECDKLVKKFNEGK